LTTRNRLFATGWVHVFEEDTAEGAVYRPEDGDIPLSRRPRERIAFDPDGRAHLFLQTDDDRYGAQPALWREEGDTIAIRSVDGGVMFRVVDQSPMRLLLKSER
jgi:hypothetical protein